MRIVARTFSALFRAPEWYLRVVFVLLGAAIALAVGIADVTLLTLLATTGAPVWTVVLVGVVLVGGPLMIGLVPAVRQIEGVAVHTLLVARFPDGLPGPAKGWTQRTRTLAWFVLHLVAGAVPVVAVIGLIWLRGSPWTVPGAVATLLVTVVLGHVLAPLGRVLLGPSYAERLERLEAGAAQAAERDRLAREIHDSIGHALSLVTMQAAAGRKLIDRDPAFAAEALATIETTSRRAVADLDHVLGLLRDEQRPETAPSPVLCREYLAGLVETAGAAGLRVEQTATGDLHRLPVLVGREAYRIVQEGLTNALKYSADSTATLHVSLIGDRLEIQLSNPAMAVVTSRAGRGLRGIGERAAALGGASDTGEDAGRWTLAVTLPAVAR